MGLKGLFKLRPSWPSSIPPPSNFPLFSLSLSSLSFLVSHTHKLSSAAPPTIFRFSLSLSLSLSLPLHRVIRWYGFMLLLFCLSFCCYICEKNLFFTLLSFGYLDTCVKREREREREFSELGGWCKLCNVYRCETV